MGIVKNVCGQPGHVILKLTVSQEWIDGTTWLFNSEKLKVISLNFEWLWSKMGVTIYLVHETLKSAVS